MNQNEKLLIQLASEKHEPLTMIASRYKKFDISISTDKDGNAHILCIGKNEEGKIKGKRYFRTVVYDDDGNIIKDQWDLKGRDT